MYRITLGQTGGTEILNSRHFCMCVPNLDNCNNYELRYCMVIIVSLVVYAFLLQDM